MDFFHLLEKTIYFSIFFVYSVHQQSRPLALSAAGTGSCPRTKEFSTIRLPHPLLHMGMLPLCSNVTRLGKEAAQKLPVLRVVWNMKLPLRFCAGVLHFRT